MLRGLDKRLSKKTDLPVFIAEDPLRAVVRGTGITLKNIERYKRIFWLWARLAGKILVSQKGLSQ